MIIPEQSRQDTPFQQLAAIVKILRDRDGCPWDRKQTPETLIKYLLEETRELVEAIEQGAPDAIREETGDLYFILALLTTIFEERKEFTAEDALQGICRKMIRRHPHVFEKTGKYNEEELRAQWERIKREEKGADRKKE